MRSTALISIFLFLGACQPVEKEHDALYDTIDPSRLKSAFEYLTPETQALQSDIFANPGYLWVEKGDELFHTAPSSETESCASCHDAGLKGVAATYPQLDAQSGKLLNLEGRINTCRERYQSLPILDYETEELLNLTAYIANQSLGQPLNVSVPERAMARFKSGKTYFYKKKGQFNFSCHQCHDLNWGKKLRGDTISQGHSNAFPGYRLEWQGFGSLHRRFRDCDTGIRAEPLPLGDQTYIDLEYYLAVRGSGLTIESPGVRR